MADLASRVVAALSVLAERDHRWKPLTWAPPFRSILPEGHVLWRVAPAELADLRDLAAEHDWLDLYTYQTSDLPWPVPICTVRVADFLCWAERPQPAKPAAAGL
jgi:hypothetical protein